LKWKDPRESPLEWHNQSSISTWPETAFVFHSSQLLEQNQEEIGESSNLFERRARKVKLLTSKLAKIFHGNPKIATLTLVLITRTVKTATGGFCLGMAV
jgi:hypothetical protein